jgi:hypothetical protein
MPNEEPKNNTLLYMTQEAADIERMILSSAETNGGEVNEALEKFLSEIFQNIQNKADSYKFIMDKLAAAEEKMRDYSREFEASARSLKTTVENMKGRIKEAMTLLSTDEIKGNKWRFKITTNQNGRLVSDIESLKANRPDLIIKRTVEMIDTEKVVKELLEGKKIDGAKYEPVITLKSYVNKEK